MLHFADASLKAARLLAASAAFFCGVEAYAAVTVSPFNPATTDGITFTLSNQFFSDAHVTSATIAQVGNSFAIDQNVTVGCTAPNAPVLISVFTVGTLPPGIYTVEAHVHLTALLSPPCPPSSELTQTATFAVTPPPIPALGLTELLPLGFAIAIVAFLQLRR
ncbi:MAG TPA: hypothetical protein VGJ88_07415 [Thermoanaerobaculia bacterium]